MKYKLIRKPMKLPANNNSKHVNIENYKFIIIQSKEILRRKLALPPQPHFQNLIKLSHQIIEIELHVMLMCNKH